MIEALKEKIFWLYFLITALVLTAFFAWELGYLTPPIPSLTAMNPSQTDIVFAIVLSFLLALNAGLFGYKKRKGSCPAGIKRATGIASLIGATALLCPVCVLLPLSLLGVSISLVFLSPFIPMLRIIALILLLGSTHMLWSKKG